MSTRNFVNKSKIFVSKECEHQIRLMDIYDKDNFFYSSFQKAAMAITGIVDRTNRYYINRKAKKCKTDSFEFMNYPNNIVSFCAQRGQGKSSAMFSMASALGEVGSKVSENNRIIAFWNDKEVNISSLDNSNPVMNSQFELLDPIDPTLMEPKDSIVRIIISKMFRAVNERWNELCKFHSVSIDEGKLNKLKGDLVEKFLECYRGLDYLNEEKSNMSTSNAFDDLYRLAELGDSANFKCAFFELISLYLQFMKNDQGASDNYFLVIQIDDADLNTQYAYEITEELRKYCVLPNVVVLMAMHMHTMNNTIEQHFVERYKTLVEFNHYYLNVDRCHEIMEKYLDKFIPTTHRVHIPSINTAIQNEYTKLELVYVKNEESSDDLIKIDSRLWREGDLSHNYQDKLLMLIYQKTGILLIKPKGYLHDFLPQNMRELAHFLPHLTNMDDIVRVDEESGDVIGTIQYIIELCRKSDDDPKSKILALNEIEHMLKNIKEIETYLLRNWSQMHLNSKQYDIIDKIHLARHSLKNRRVTELIRRYSPSDKRVNLVDKDDREKRSGIIYTREQRNIGFVPYSDVVFTLYNLRHLEDPQNEYPLACAIQMYYTLYLHQIMLVGLKNWLSEPIKENRKSPFCDLVTFLGYRIFPQIYYDRVKSFEKFAPIDSDNLKDQLSEAERKIVDLFLYRTKKVNTGDKYTRRYYGSVVKGKDSEYDSNSFCFDPLKPIMSILISRGCIVEDNLVELTVDFLRIVCNTDVQDMLYHSYFKSSENIPPISQGETDENPLMDIVQGAFRQIDVAINNNLLMNQNSNISNKLFDVNNLDGPIHAESLKESIFKFFTAT